MSCYHPNKGFIIGINENGKRDLRFASTNVCYIYSVFEDFSQFHKSYVSIEAMDLPALEIYNEFLLVDRSCRSVPVYYAVNSVSLPCGQCLGCRIDRTRDWANRMVLEASYYERNCFITLTYDDEHIPKSSYRLEDGNEYTSYTLRKRDLQLFMKRLRRVTDVYDSDGKVTDESKIRFYACGEYGSKTMRPHYHIIVFNWFPVKTELHHRDMRGFYYYTSEILSRLWPFGIHLVTSLSWETCAYTARYVTKKLGNKDRDLYDIFNLEREFSLMSRKPGLARRYYEDHKHEIYELDKPYIISLSEKKEPLKFKPPRYFDDLFDIENPSRIREVKENSKRVMDNIQSLKLSKTDKNLFGMLEDEELNFEARVDKLKRL